MLHVTPDFTLLVLNDMGSTVIVHVTLATKHLPENHSLAGAGVVEVDLVHVWTLTEPILRGLAMGSLARVGLRRLWLLTSPHKKAPHDEKPN